MDDLIDFTPELRAEALEIFNRYRSWPIFTPPSLRDESPGGTLGTLQLPGWVGGANWNGAAYDPETQMLYVPSITAPIQIWLREAPDDSPFRQRPLSITTASSSPSPRSEAHRALILRRRDPDHACNTPARRSAAARCRRACASS